MTKFNVNGNIVLSAYTENMEVVNGDPEQTFKDKFVAALKKGGIDIDWLEVNNFESEELKDHSKGLNNALYDSGYGIKVVEMPTRIGKGYTNIGGEDMGEVELWKAKVSNAKELVFLIVGDSIYLPCNPMNYFLIQDTTTVQNINDIFKVYWLKSNDVYILTDEGHFALIYNSKNNYNPVLGQRLAKVRAKVKDSVYLLSSSARELNLASATDENVAYDADFYNAHDVEPYCVTMTKRIV
jgi:hypothetical protein